MPTSSSSDLRESVRAIDAPMLSIVIAAHDASEVIATCLDALMRQEGGPGLQIIVADSSRDGTDRIVRERYPRVQLLHCDEPLPVPELRGLGIARAQGSIIAILDPYSVASPEWSRRLVAAHQQHASPVIGGVVGLHDSGRRSLPAWAIYFNEYGLFMPPVRPGPVPIVPGSNVSYKRAALFDGDRPRHPVFWKTFVNQEAARNGHPLWLEPSIRVDLNKPIAFRDFLATRYLHGRCFAGMRVAGRPWFERLARAMTAPLLPPLQMVRWTRGIWPKRAERTRYLLSLPLQMLLFASWAWGECCGYLLGTGDTCQRLHY